MMGVLGVAVGLDFASYGASEREFNLDQDQLEVFPPFGENSVQLFG